MRYVLDGQSDVEVDVMAVSLAIPRHLMRLGNCGLGMKILPLLHTRILLSNKPPLYDLGSQVCHLHGHRSS